MAVVENELAMLREAEEARVSLGVTQEPFESGGTIGRQDQNWTTTDGGIRSRGAIAPLGVLDARLNSETMIAQ
jgi:hypothetical protein